MPTEYGDLRSVSAYSVQTREKKDQNNSEYGRFLCGVNVLGGTLKVVHGRVCALSFSAANCFLKLNRIKNLCLSKLFPIKFQIDAIKFFASVKKVIDTYFSTPRANVPFVNYSNE